MSVRSYEGFLDKNRFYTDSELKEMFDENFKSNFGPSLVLKNFDDFRTYSPDDIPNDEAITINIDGENKKISKKLVKDLVEDEGMYRYLLLNMDNDLGIAAKIIFIADDCYYCIKLLRVELASCLTMISSDYEENNSFNVKVNMRIGLIQSMITEKSLLAKSYGDNKLFEVGVDGKKVLLPEEYIVKLLVIGNKKDFLRELDKDKYGYSKEIICYAIVQYVEKNRILYKYSLSKKTLNFYKRLKNYEIVDFESLNKNRISNVCSNLEEDTTILDTVIVPSYIIDLINDFPHKDYSPLEKALYLYIELSYSYSKYLEESDIKDELSTNNFILIFANILELLGISFTISQNVITNVLLDNNKITFSSGEFTCSIDSNKEINLDDIISNKIGNEYLSLTSSNTALISKIKFKELTKKIYADYIEDKRKDIEFNQNLNKYKYQFSISTLDKTTRVNLFLCAIGRKDLKVIDSIDYIRNVFNNIFGNDHSVSLGFLLTSNRSGGNPIIVLTFSEPTRYIIVNNEDSIPIKEVSESELVGLFDDGYYLYSANQTLEFRNGEKYDRHN